MIAIVNFVALKARNLQGICFSFNLNLSRSVLESLWGSIGERNVGKELEWKLVIETITMSKSIDRQTFEKKMP